MIQIRNVPVALHRKLKSRAALAGMSLSDYVLAEMRRMAELPTMEEMLDRLSDRKPVSSSISVVDAIRQERDRI